MDLTANGQPVTALKRKTSVIPSFLRERTIQWVEGDVLDPVALEDVMQGVSKVYHCAAMVSLSNRERKHMYRVNIQGTANVVNLCLDLGRSEEHTSELQSLMRISYADFCLKKKKQNQ